MKPTILKNPQGLTAAIYLGDCETILPKLKCDCVVTSPPFNLVSQYSGLDQFNAQPDARMESWYPDSMPEDDYQAWQKRCVNLMVAACSGSVFYNHQVRYAWGRKGAWYHPLMWLMDEQVWCEIIWNRGKGVSGSKRPVLADQRIYMIGKPKVWNPIGLTSVWDFPEDRKGSHPCAFPEELPRRCIAMTTSEGDTVMDPFTGSGTTLIAAAKLGRHSIGVEISEDYVRVAVEKLRAIQFTPA